jgi:hypothetical protein
VYFTALDGAMIGVSKDSAAHTVYQSGGVAIFLCAIDTTSFYQVWVGSGGQGVGRFLFAPPSPYDGFGYVNTSSPMAIAVAEPLVAYITGGDQIWCYRSECDSAGNLFIGNQPGAWGIAVDSQSVYWANHGDHTIQTAARAHDAGPTTTLAKTFDAPTDLALDSDAVYWLEEGGEVMKLPLVDGGAPVLLATAAPGPHAMALDSDSVYWITPGDITGAVFEVHKDGTGFHALAIEQTNPSSIAADPTIGGNVYWANNVDGGAVLSVPK